ncbi:MAG: hypothetical protein FJ301_06810 [Planctomycetes bacterium]|nr:hypothetical protein [Planctomycetota bacterium]
MTAFAYFVFFLAPIWALSHVMSRRAAPLAVAQAVVVTWLTMPLLRIDMPGLPDLDKETLIGCSTLAGVLLAGRRQGARIGASPCDVPMICLCLAPIGSSLANDLGVFDGLSSALRYFFTFGLPFVIGRIIFVDAAAVGALARTLALGVLCYLPAVLFESRMAPQLHMWVFGMPGRVGWETVDVYGPLRWKPSVFLQSPLELTLLMGIGFLAVYWTRVTTSARRFGPLTIGWASRLAFFATLMGKSLGGFTLTIVGLAALRATRALRHPIIIALLLTVAPLYISLRASGWWDGMSLIEFLRENVSVRRAESFLTRIDNENILVAKALEQPLFGWGGWGRNRVFSEEGIDISVTDGLWVILLGINGWTGLCSWLALVTSCHLPILRHWRRAGASRVADGPILWAMVVVILHSIDSMANAMTNPIYYMLMGALVSVGQVGRYVMSSPGAVAEAVRGALASNRRAPLQPRRNIAAG